MKSFTVMGELSLNEDVIMLMCGYLQEDKGIGLRDYEVQAKVYTR
jgi:hypothetical protein